MKKTESKIQSLIKKTVTHMVETELYEWPPQCAALLYQPTRPPKDKNDSLREKTRSDTENVHR